MFTTRHEPAFARFVDKCRHDPVTGCVLWTGARTGGRGNTAPYGAFWYERRTVYAHRWAAQHIHGQSIDGLQVGHLPTCANTLCVEHVEPVTQAVNLVEQMARGSGACGAQLPAERRYWLMVSLGYEPAPEILVADNDGVPFHLPPRWLGQYPRAANVDCPF